MCPRLSERVRDGRTRVQGLLLSHASLLRKALPTSTSTTTTTMRRQDKTTTERHARILRELVKRPENKTCADCKRQGLVLCIVYSGRRDSYMSTVYRCPLGFMEHASLYCSIYLIFSNRRLSLNRGVFICIRCSGIHRSIGTHITKVKSVDLDTWTPEQMEVRMVLL